MLARRLLSIPRLGRNTVITLLAQHTQLPTALPHGLRANTQDLHIRKLVWKQHEVFITGNADDQPVDIAFDGRAPVATATGAIDLSLFRPARDAGLVLSTGDRTYHLPPPSWVREKLAMAAHIPFVMRKLWSERGTIRAFLKTGDAAIALRLRRQFGFIPDTDKAALVPHNLFDAAPAQPITNVTIIIPVFNAFDQTRRLLDALPRTLDVRHQVLIVDDGSDDPRIGPALDAFVAARSNTRLLRHGQNKGFVAAVNAGLQAADKSHVILLNSDTIPPPGWVDRLLAPMVTDPMVASVTPMSNNAEILSIPVAGLETEPNLAMVRAIDTAAQGMRATDMTLPTGIGFCLALNRTFLDRLGGFDPAFGRGYGEEVDWCQKAIQAGGRNVVATNLFVGHQGGSSFGASAKARRIQAATKIINARYPNYADDVQRWILDAPLDPEKLALSLAWLGHVSDAAVPIYIGHAMGGGAEAVLASEIAAHLAGGAPGAIVLRTGGPMAWRVELHGQGFRQACDASDAALVHRLLAPVANRRVIYSCGVGAANPMHVPRMLLELTADGGGLDLRVHDFFPISPSWNLLDRTGWFRGVPAATDGDPVHQPPGCTLSDWRRVWAEVIDRCDRITVFAPSGRDLLTDAYPNAAAKIDIRPHTLLDLPDIVPPGGRTIGVLGGINRPKGGAVLTSIAPHLGHRLVVIGEMDGQFRLCKPHQVHGRYVRKEIEKLARAYDVGIWLIPSICPETFSFATHEALATGLPVLGFSVGAQGDALSAASNGFVLSASPDNAKAVARDIQVIFDQTVTRSRATS